MTTVKELIAYLQTVDQNAQVEVLRNVQGQWTDYVEVVPLELPNLLGHSSTMDNYGGCIIFGER